jgi:hypothetical protein
LLLLFAPALHDATRELVVMYQAKEARAEAEAKNRALYITGTERVWDMGEMARRWGNDANIKADFRLDEAGLRALETGLDMMEVVRLGNRNGHWYKGVTRTKVLLVTLMRLRRCSTCRELGNFFGLQMSVVGMAFNHGLACIDGKVKVGLQDVRRWIHHVPGWREAIERKTNGAFCNARGFIDVVMQRVCKISGVIVLNGQLDPQRCFYCGYKGFRAVKFQGVEAPCSTCINFYGPGVGSVSDSTMMQDPRIMHDLDELARHYNYLFGLCDDPAHPPPPVICDAQTFHGRCARNYGKADV